MPLSMLRILVVDDYEPLRYLKCRLLRKAGAKVLEARHGAEALSILGKEKVDLALLDVNLPDMSALELRSAMRTIPGAAAVPVIYTSASERHPELDESEVFFQEPLDAVKLFDAIKKAVEGASAHGTDP